MEKILPLFDRFCSKGKHSFSVYVLFSQIIAFLPNLFGQIIAAKAQLLGRLLSGALGGDTLENNLSILGGSESPRGLLG